MTQTQKKYWFRNRRYGWGYTPVTWEGWLSLIVLIGAQFALFSTIMPAIREQSTAVHVAAVAAIVVADLFVIAWVARTHGPSPRWRWGKKSTDNPDKDF